MEIRKLSRCGSRSPDDASLGGHFTLFFCRGRKRNVQRLNNARAQLLFCSLNLLGDVLVAVAIVFCFRSLCSEIMNVAMTKTELADLVLYHPRIRPPYRCHPEGQQVFHEATLAIKTGECCNESDHFAENEKESKVYLSAFISPSLPSS